MMRWLGLQISKRFQRGLLVVTAAIATLPLWQNCGNVQLQTLTFQEELGSVQSKESPPTPFRIPDAPDYIMRVAFLVDVSASMLTRGCSGTGADHDTGNCSNGNEGADPYFNRLRMIENWIVQIDDYLAAKSLPQDRLEIVFIPFSMASARGGGPNTPNGSILMGTGADQVELFLNQKVFTADRSKILRILDTYRKMYVSALDLGPNSSRLDPSWGLNNILQKNTYKAAAALYIKTSIPAPSIESMTESIRTEINQIQSQTPDKLSQTRFEAVFLSDGVAKPQLDDIRQTFELFWRARKIYRDDRYSVLSAPNQFCTDNYQIQNPCQFFQADLSMGGHNCSQNCRLTLDEMIKTKTWPTTYPAACRKCIVSVLDYKSLPQENGDQVDQPQSLINAIDYQWGDYQLNFPLRIQRSIKQLQSLFESFPQVQFRFNFVRLDSDSPSYKVPPLLLSSERNWLEAARQKFKGGHRHVVVTNNRLPFSLFPGQSEINGYKLGQFFIINPQARINSIGIVAIDSDADGLFDHEEESLANYDKQNSRTKGKCLDVIQFKTNSCVEMGCDAAIDLDGDGLNQCDENTLMTDDRDFDSDDDGISDYLEVVYGLTPLVNDQNQDNNGDGISNFVNFTLGAGPWTEIEEIEALKKVKFTMREAQPVMVPVGTGTALVPTYAFHLLNLPTLENLESQGGQDTFYNLSKAPPFLNTPPILPIQFLPQLNRVLMMGRIDHTQNVGDSFWIYQPLQVPFQKEPVQLDIRLDQMKVMPWLDSYLGGGE